MSDSNNIRKEQHKSSITVSRVYENQFRAGLLTAELKQTVTNKSWYPGESTSSNLSDNVFGAAEFGFEEKEFESVETRVAWLDIPAGMTVADVEGKLSSMPGATLYRIMSNKPILTDGQKFAIDSPDIELTLDKIADSQAVRYPESHEQGGELALDKAGKVQYRSVFFKTSAQADVDQRTEDASEMYLSEALKAEINQIETVAGQSLDS